MRFWLGKYGCRGQVKRPAAVPWSYIEAYSFSIAFREFVLKSIIIGPIADHEKVKISTAEKALLGHGGF